MVQARAGGLMVDGAGNECCPLLDACCRMCQCWLGRRLLLIDGASAGVRRQGGDLADSGEAGRGAQSQDAGGDADADQVPTGTEAEKGRGRLPSARWQEEAEVLLIPILYDSRFVFFLFNY